MYVFVMPWREGTRGNSFLGINLWFFMFFFFLNLFLLVFDGHNEKVGGLVRSEGVGRVGLVDLFVLLFKI